DWSAASDLNPQGQIVGEMRFTPGVDLLHAFLYDDGAFTDLGSLPPLGTSGAYSAAHALNDQGWIVGEWTQCTNGVLLPDRRYAATRAFFWAGALRDLGSLGKQCAPFLSGEQCFERSVATDINHAGTLVGFSSTPTANAHAFTTDGGPLVDLGA